VEEKKQCAVCGGVLNRRNRCFACKPSVGRPHTGKVIECQGCGTGFYVTAGQLRDVPERQPKFCSLNCKYAAASKKRPPWAKPEEKTFHSSGYVLVWAPDHPRATATNKRVLEHVLIAEKMLGRYLRDGEQVHHRDHDKTNNDPSNLVVLTASEHAALHAKEAQVQSTRVEIQCQECGKAFKAKRYQVAAEDPQSRRKYCSLGCRHKAWGRQMAQRRKTLKE
jgi:hypothetical protein